jgi:hypothetical protein
MRLMNAVVRRLFEDSLQYLERLVLCSALAVAGGTLIHTPELLSNRPLWLAGCYGVVLIAVAAAFATAAVYTDKVAELFQSVESRRFVLIAGWTVFCSVAIASVAFTGKLTDIQAKKEPATTHLPGKELCSSVADCSK